MKNHNHQTDQREGGVPSCMCHHHHQTYLDIRNRIREMHGTQEVFVIQKSLYDFDVKRDKNKVSMPLSQINPDFFKETEREALDQQKPIGVQFVEPSNMVYTMVFNSMVHA